MVTELPSFPRIRSPQRRTLVSKKSESIFLHLPLGVNKRNTTGSGARLLWAGLQIVFH
jgi:hypothetical protein